MANTGVILCGHGTRSNEGYMEFLELSRKFATQYPEFAIVCGFLEFNKPNFEEALQELVTKGIQTIIILPVFLFTGVHLQYDIPLAFSKLAKKYSKINIKMARQIGVCDQLTELTDKLIADSRTYNTQNFDSSLLLAGVGASLKEANADLAKLTRLVWEQSGFGFATYAFVSKMTKPSIKEGLELLEKLSYNCIVVVPVLLFSGYYLQDIFHTVDNFSKTTQKEIIVSKPFGSDNLILQALAVRMLEAIDGKVNLLDELPEGLVARRDFI
jgi:sirohydrochlorin cobaltochelatase